MIDKTKIPVKYIIGTYTKSNSYPSVSDLYYLLMVKYIDKKRVPNITDKIIQQILSKVDLNMEYDSVIEFLISNNFIEKISDNKYKLLI